MRSWARNVYNTSDILDTCINGLFLIVFTVTVYLNIKIVLVFDEPCASLRTLTLVYIIILYAVIALLLCCWVCSLLVNGEEERKDEAEYY
jgi:hypothetical protein